MCRLIVSEIVTAPCITSRVEIIGKFSLHNVYSVFFQEIPIFPRLPLPEEYSLMYYHNWETNWSQDGLTLLLASLLQIIVVITIHSVMMMISNFIERWLEIEINIYWFFNNKILSWEPSWWRYHAIERILFICWGLRSPMMVYTER